jgi:Amidase
MKSSEYLQHDAVGLAELVTRGETTAAELLELALGQSAKAQPKTNAICLMMESEARSQLKKQLTGPFAGVPFLIKDCAQDYAGLPTTYGSRAMRTPAPEHAHVVRRYLDAGFLIFGKTNLRSLRSRASPIRNCSAAPTIPGMSITRPAAPAAALLPRSPRASCRWRQAMTAVAPSAFPPPVAACSDCVPRAHAFPQARPMANIGTAHRAKE